MITAEGGGSSVGCGLLALAALCLCGAPATAQFRVESQVVRVDVSVDDRNGPVLNLDRDDFELYEAGARVPFRLLEPASVPVTVLFAVDVSASTIGERQRQLGKGAALFAGGLTDADSCAVIAFAREPFWVRRFTPCGPAVGEDVQAMSAGGLTTVRDSLLLSLALLHRQKGRGVLLLFTDAYDNFSWTWDGLVMEAVRRSGALVYSIVARPRRAVRLVAPRDAGYRLGSAGVRGERRPTAGSER